MSVSVKKLFLMITDLKIDDNKETYDLDPLTFQIGKSKGKNKVLRFDCRN